MKVLFVGDVYVPDNEQNIRFDADMQNVFNRCDYRVACCEAPFCSPESVEYTKIGPNLRQGGYFPELATRFSHLSLANNHSMDYGKKGLSSTIDFLKSNSIVPIGAGFSYPDMYLPSIIVKDGVSIALFCWAEAQYGCCKNEDNESGYAWMLNPITYRLIQEYKSKTDYVVLFLHAGLEDEDIPICEWRNQYKSFIDYGADLVIAGHPHVIQGKEQYKDKWIYYSLGNFYFSEYQLEDSRFHESLVLECDFTSESIVVTEHFALFSRGEVSLMQNVLSRFESLSLILTNKEDYIRESDRMVLRCWEEYYKYYYSFPILRPKVNVPFYRKCFNRIMKGYVSRCFLPAVSANRLYHNINIDTHRFVVSRVCSLKSKTY